MCPQHITAARVDQAWNFARIRRSCYELQSNLIMINNCVAFDHKIPNKNLMSIVNMNYMYVYGSDRNPSLVFMTI